MTAPRARPRWPPALRVGDTGPRDWSGGSPPADAFDAKADALALLAAMGAPTGNLRSPWTRPIGITQGRSGSLRLGPNVIAWFGEIHPAVLADLDIKASAVGCEVFLDRVPLPKAKRGGPRQAHADPLTVPAGDPRLRLYRRPGGYRRELAARRQGADKA